MQKTSAKSKQRRQEILAAALKCFTEHGLAATTIESIRKESGASVGSLYHHFGSKEAIAGALYIEGMQNHFEKLRGSLESGGGVRSGDGPAKMAGLAEFGVKTIVRTYCEWISENPSWAKFIFSTRGEMLDSSQRKRLKAENRAHMNYLKEFFREAQEQGEIKTYPASLYHSLLIGPAQDYARQWLNGRVREPLDTHTDILSEAAWRLFKTH